jgi:hypothetical protein
MKKKKIGRPKLKLGSHRQLVAARVAPDTAKYFKQHDMRIGSLLDQWVRERRIADQAAFERNSAKPPCETMVLDEEDGSDVVIEQARGLLAMIAERGTAHLSVEQIEILNTSFEVLINNYLATFKKREMPAMAIEK